MPGDPPNESEETLITPSADDGGGDDGGGDDGGGQPAGDLSTADAKLVDGRLVDGRSVGSDPESTFIPLSSSRTGLVIANRYVLKERLGEGGMGEVWLAAQTEPVKRHVAIKLIKAGMDSKAVLMRFEQERQALAVMNHPNIARVYDAGVTPTGHPFFAMELVDGQTLTKYCDQNRLSPRARLELFVLICQAIQHAHQKGIVHRDLKPANILVTVVDGKPVPKVIDFGVAKATGGKLTEQTLSTGFGAVVGTLEYMSPEQAGTTGADVDTRADIYSLGVVLYELLTGLRPFDGERLRKAALSEMIRIIREDDPSRPSTRLSTDAALPSVAALRQTEPRRLMAQLRGELDWVVMKCLEKSRDRRYETATGLARDIMRYLSDEPVEARPPSAAYRLHKLYTRNKGRVITAGLLLVTLIAGIIGTTLGWFEAQRQTATARSKAEEAEIARAGEAEQRQVAEQANQLAIDALESFTSNLMGKLLGGRTELSKTEVSILNDALSQWEVFAQSRGTSPQARRIRAKGAANVSTIQFKLGMIKEAEANDRKALGLWESLVAESLGNQADQLNLAISHQELGGTLRGIGRRQEAGEHFRAGLQILESLLPKNPGDSQLRKRAGDANLSVANAARDAGEWPAAQSHYLQALALFEQLADEFPANLDHQHSMAACHWGLALRGKRLAQINEATGHYQKAISIYQQLVARDSVSVDYREGLGGLHREFGVMISDEGKDAAGAEQLLLAIPLLQAVAEELPSVPRHRYDYAKAIRDYAQILRFLKQPEQSQQYFDQALQIQKVLVADNPTNVSYSNDMAISLRMLGDLLTDQQKLEEALTAYGQAIQILTTAFVQDRTYVSVRRSLMNCHLYRAETLDALNRRDEALLDWDKALEYCDAEKRNSIRFARIDSRIRAGAVAESIDELQQLANIEVSHATHYFGFARLFALAAKSLPDRNEELSLRSVELLQKAIALGFDNFDRLNNDPDLQHLAELEDFRSLREAISTESNVD